MWWWYDLVLKTQNQQKQNIVYFQTDIEFNCRDSRSIEKKRKKTFFVWFCRNPPAIFYCLWKVEMTDNVNTHTHMDKEMSLWVHVLSLWLVLLAISFFKIFMFTHVLCKFSALLILWKQQYRMRRRKEYLQQQYNNTTT